jgi:hypothetical protein
LACEHTAAPIGRSNQVSVLPSEKILTRRGLLGCLMTVLVMAAVLEGCGIKGTGKTLAWPSPFRSQLPSVQVTIITTVAQTIEPTFVPIIEPSITPTPKQVVFGQLMDKVLDLRAGPVDVPLELLIPTLKVKVPMLGVGLTKENRMDAPKGPIGDPVWHTAFWYRGSVVPGESGTAAIAGHVNDPLGNPEIFAHLKELQPGDLIIVHDRRTTIDIRFIVDQIELYSTQESSDPAVLARIFGGGPKAAFDGLSHLTLITCAGNIVNGQFDHHTVVYATRSK